MLRQKQETTGERWIRNVVEVIPVLDRHYWVDSATTQYENETKLETVSCHQ